jgi:hypothetical protein
MVTSSEMIVSVPSVAVPHPFQTLAEGEKSIPSPHFDGG